MQIKQQAYKGVRDFYPADYQLQAYIFGKWAQVAESYGYERYDASTVEYLELYRLRQQTNTEILNEQIYSFIDRGERPVALRPEMTPSLARMVASRRHELSYPLRWYSIPNLWRYERPQRGRLREHWQLNLDCFGLDGPEAELELILAARDILKAFGAEADLYSIRLNSRALMEEMMGGYLGLNRVQSESLMLLFDRYDKMGQTAFFEACRQLLPPDEKARQLIFKRLKSLLACSDLEKLPAAVRQMPGCRQLASVMAGLRAAQVTNASLDFKIVRGFDYYTGVVFEIFDRASGNRRSMFGGGRYDNLLAAFGVEPLSGAGFGMGDVTLANFLQSHHLLPKLPPSQLDIYVVLLEDADYAQALPVFKALRAEGFKVAVDSRPLKPAKKVEAAVKRGVRNVLFIGAADLKEELFNLKHLPTRQERRLSLARIISKLAQA